MNADLIGDWALAVLTVAVTFAVSIRIQFLDKTLFCRRWAYRFVAFGWVLMSARLWVSLMMGGNPTIHPVSQIAVAIIALGTCWVSFDVVMKHHNQLCKWGRHDSDC